MEAYLDNMGYVLVDTVKGELAIACGEYDLGISFLQKAFAELGRMQGRPPFFYGAVALAEGWRKKGNLEQAISVLERATRQRHGMYPYSGPFWMDAYFRLAKLYREYGRDSEAQEIEDELRTLLKLADPDHYILQELEQL
jgi:tetratricopeptide (TPR) repeat protein